MEAAKGGDALPENSVLLTFDDGYIDHYTNVFPLLAEMGIPAFFSMPGKIIAQNIDAGTRVSEGTNIELTVSKGPEQITMPEVTGSTYDDASARLTALGFKVSRADIANDGTEISGTVKSASVQAGTQHRKGTLVVLQVWDEPATMTTEATEATTESDTTDTSENSNFFGTLTGGTN